MCSILEELIPAWQDSAAMLRSSKERGPGLKGKSPNDHRTSIITQGQPSGDPPMKAKFLFTNAPVKTRVTPASTFHNTSSRSIKTDLIGKKNQSMVEHGLKAHKTSLADEIIKTINDHLVKLGRKQA